jgi:hypothetical protein
MDPYKSYQYKHKLSLAFSLVIMAWGLVGLSQQLQLVVFVYPYLSARSLASVFGADIEMVLFQHIFLTSITNFITIAYGLALLLRPSHLVKVSQYLVGVIILVVTYYLSRYVFALPEILTPHLLSDLIQNSFS